MIKPTQNDLIRLGLGIAKGRITSNELETLYEGHIGHDSILCTDSHKSYMQFANDLSLEHKRIKRGKHKEGLYHIQHN